MEKGVEAGVDVNSRDKNLKEKLQEELQEELQERQQTAGIYQALSVYCAGEDYPCHMPGHKRNPDSGEMADFYRIDITEIDGFDNLHHAEGMIKEAQERANRLYGAQETYFLVNGSTCGVLAAIMSVTQPGDEILIARNCHKAVYHAMILQGLRPRYYYPEIIQEYGIHDGVDAEKIGNLLDKYPACNAVVLTSPTYEGIMSDIRAAARAAHERGKALIVDEAHGAHLDLWDRGRQDDRTCEAGSASLGKGQQGAVAAGADLVIHSLHKTLPAMTQTALLHVNGSLVNRDRLRRYLTMLQSSSPSYVLMASMDSCIRFLKEQGEERFAFFEAQYDTFCKKTALCRHLRIGRMSDVTGKGYRLTAWDIGKIVISVKDTSMRGPQLYDILRQEYHLQMEMAADTFVLAMMTVMDTEEGWQRLADAICAIDDRIEKGTGGEMISGSNSIPCMGRSDLDSAEYEAEMKNPSASYPEAQMTPSQAFHSAQEEIPIEDAAGRLAADFINLYPPGIPLIVPGEVIDGAMIRKLNKSLKLGLTVLGVSESGQIRVVREEGCR